MITIEDYTSFFLAVILGLGICFELPILMFFLALFGIVDGKFLLKQSATPSSSSSSSRRSSAPRRTPSACVSSPALCWFSIWLA